MSQLEELSVVELIGKLESKMRLKVAKEQYAEALEKIRSDIQYEIGLIDAQIDLLRKELGVRNGVTIEN